MTPPHLIVFTDGQPSESNAPKVIFWTKDLSEHEVKIYLLPHLCFAFAFFWTLNSSSALVPAVPI